MKQTDHERIFEWLADGQWHCGTELNFMKDDRTRISEINKKKIIIEGIPCDGRCGIQHRSKTLKMRRWVKDIENTDFDIKNAVRAEFRQKSVILTPIKELLQLSLL